MKKKLATHLLSGEIAALSFSARKRSACVSVKFSTSRVYVVSVNLTFGKEPKLTKLQDIACLHGLMNVLMFAGVLHFVALDSR